MCDSVGFQSYLCWSFQLHNQSMFPLTEEQGLVQKLFNGSQGSTHTQQKQSLICFLSHVGFGWVFIHIKLYIFQDSIGSRNPSEPNFGPPWTFIGLEELRCSSSPVQKFHTIKPNQPSLVPLVQSCIYHSYPGFCCQ